MTPIISDPSDTKGWANAASQHRATDASHEALLHGLRLPVGIDFRDGPAAAWLLESRALAKQLNHESTRDGGCANNAPPTDQ